MKYMTNDKKSTNMSTTKDLARDLKRSPLQTLDQLPDEDIAAVITAANHAYYNVGKPIFSDSLYDIIRDYLKKRDPNHAVLKQPQRSKKIKLPVWMGLERLMTKVTKVKSAIVCCFFGPVR